MPMIAPLILSFSLATKAFGIKLSISLGHQNTKLVWQSFSSTRSSKKIQNVTPDLGYNFMRSDGTNCFGASKDAFATYAERGGKAGVLVVWKTGPPEFLRTNQAVSDISFFDQGHALALCVNENQTTLYRATHGLQKIGQFPSRALECNRSCAIISSPIGPTARQLPQSSRIADRVKLDKILNWRNLAVLGNSGNTYPPIDASQLRLSPGGNFVVDTRVDSSNSFDQVAFSCVTGLFGEKGEMWEWRTDVEPSEIFFYDDNHLVFRVGEPFKMGLPGKTNRYGPGIYFLDCHTRKVTKSRLTSPFSNSELGGDLVYLSALV